MDVALTPDLYSPNINENGDYIDHVPIIVNGIYCPCGSRKDKVYETKQKFSIHTRTKKHMEWIKGLNLNKTNHIIESIRHKETIETQKKIIRDLEHKIKDNLHTIEYLASKLSELSTTSFVCDLHDID